MQQDNRREVKKIRENITQQVYELSADLKEFQKNEDFEVATAIHDEIDKLLQMKDMLEYNGTDFHNVLTNDKFKEFAGEDLATWEVFHFAEDIAYLENNHLEVFLNALATSEEVYYGLLSYEEGKEFNLEEGLQAIQSEAKALREVKENAPFLNNRTEERIDGSLENLENLRYQIQRQRIIREENRVIEPKQGKEREL